MKRKIYSIIMFCGVLLFITAAVPLQLMAADMEMTLHRVEQRYKDDYKTYPLTAEEVGLLQNKAKTDTISAMKLAGYYFEKGEYEKSYPLFLKAAESGDMQAIFMVGISRLNGRGVAIGDRDFVWESIQMVDTLQTKNPIALYIAAEMQADGYKEAKKNSDGSAQNYRDAAAQGVTADTLVYQSQYSKVMAQMGYGRYGIKDSTGTLMLASKHGLPVVHPAAPDPNLNPTPELRALFEFLTEEYGTETLVKNKFGKPQKEDYVESKSAQDGKPIKRHILIYPGFKAVFINIGRGYEWERLVADGNKKVSFNGLKIGSSSNDLLVITGVGTYLKYNKHSITMTDKMNAYEFAEFSTKNKKVVLMKAYKIFE